MNLLICFALGCAGIAFAQSGVDNATQTGVFQMEGNALRDASICFMTAANGGPAIATPVSGSCPAVGTWSLITFGGNTDDWSNILPNGGSALARSFASDAVSVQSDSSFLGTSSKDTMDISQWAWTGSKAQGKDDIAHAFAAAYTLANGHTAVYMGMDRYDGSGDSTAGFWLVQDSAFDLCTAAGQGSRGPNASCAAAGTFAGHHTVGDLLVVSDFSQGGAVATINVYTWTGSTIALDVQRSPAPCDPTTGNNTLCGAVNNAFVQTTNKQNQLVLVATTVATGGWSFSDKSNSSSYLTGEFLEVGLDLNSIFGNNLPCFTTFFAETRSSTSASASLSDLTAPVSFPLCGASITKNCTGASILPDGATVRYSFGGQVTNSGIANLSNVTVSDSPNNGSGFTNLVINQPDLSGSGGILGSQLSVPYTGHFDMTTVSSTVQNQATVNATTPGGTAISPASAFWLTGGATLGGSCAPAPSGRLALTKSCSTSVTSGNPLTIQVSFTGTITNNANVQVSAITITDTPSATITLSNIVNGSATSGNGSLTLAPGGTAQFSGSFTANQCTPTAAGRCDFQDTVNASGTGALGAGTISALPVTAHCALCPSGSCTQ